MEQEIDALKNFFKNNREIFETTNIEYITHQSIFDDGTGAYFLASMYREEPDDEDYISDDFDIICYKFGLSPEFNSTTGAIFRGKEITIEKEDSFEIFLDSLQYKELSIFYFSQKLENQLSEKPTSRKKKI